MQEQLIIRVPVIVSRLPELRHFQTIRNYSLPDPFQRTEEIRIKVRHSKVELQGQSLQVIFDVELLLLIEDPSGSNSLWQYDQRLRDRILINTLYPDLDVSEPMEFYLDMEHFNWDGEVKGKELIIRYYCSYSLMAAVQQAVSLQGQTQLMHHQPGFNEEQQQPSVEIETQQLWLENASLRRKLSLLEKDLSRLKHSLQKMETKNYRLKQELRSSKGEQTRLSEKLASRETQLQKHQQVNGLQEQQEKAPQQAYVRQRLRKMLGFSL